MMNSIRYSSRLIGIMLALVLIFASGCKSKKKAAEAAAAEKARIEREAAIQKQKDEEEARRRQADEQARKDAEAREMQAKASEPKAKLGRYFESIANSTSVTSANSSIAEALSLFASPDTPVLIVISESGGQKDYDRPTTIRDYLNYLKDQRKNANMISNLQFDNSGKITEVELRKN